MAVLTDVLDLGVLADRVAYRNLKRLAYKWGWVMTVDTWLAMSAAWTPPGVDAKMPWRGYV